ncbi:MAG: DUF3943 domain-containing protein [Burkholderiales bacterium]|nr:DUF3943 domain-containing protein [Burkholderiales bacterium]
MPKPAIRSRSALFATLLIACGANAQTAPEKVPPERDWTLPAMEILGFDFLVNRYNRCCGTGRDDYAVSMESIRRNLHSSWGVDSDPFRTNQLGHPYQGSMYHGFARSAGFNYWESLGYTFAGSAAWEIAGEKTRPSRNDQVSTGIGGSFLGESLFRMSNLLLEKGGGVSPFWRETGAALISPSTGFNRHLAGRGLDTIFDSHNAPYYSRLQVGFMGTAQNAQGNSVTRLRRNELQADFALDYGMPGKDGYHYERPFDYFAFQATASSANLFENVMTRGLLVGREYQAGKTYRGLWGLYGSYDYISPQTFRISSTALSLGTTGQWRASDAVTMQGTAMAGVGYAAVGTLNSAAAGVDQDYHYGVAPQALVSPRFIFGDRSSLDITGREYFVSRVAASARGGHDNIARADIAYTWRIKDQHAVTIKYLWNRRDATYPDLGDRRQTRGTVGIFYTLLGHDRFGTVDTH